MNRFDVIVYTIRRRRGRRRPFEVRWRAVGRARSKSFITRALADSYRAELVRAARKGLEFDPQTGEPVLWAEPEPVTVTWYQHAAAYAVMKWPTLAAHSRASVAEALATVTPALTRAALGRPPAAELRTVLYQHAFNPARTATADPATTRVLAWLAAVARIRADLTAFFGCLYYAALRPEEAIALRLADCHLPRHGWGMLTLTQAAPRTAAAWTGNGTSHEQRGLKHRPEGSARTVPIPPSWSPCSATTAAATAPHPTTGCSAEPAADRSAKAVTAAPGTPPAHRSSSPQRLPPLLPAAPMTCGTPRCRSG